MNRGSEDRRIPARPRQVTSMRPRFMNRGSPLQLPASTQSGSTSMRPRFMNRGSRQKVADFAKTQRHFNEAPIHESGK